MTPNAFFRAVAAFAALVAGAMAVFGIVELARGQWTGGVFCLILAAVNAFAWRMFSAWGRR